MRLSAVARGRRSTCSRRCPGDDGVVCPTVGPQSSGRAVPWSAGAHLSCHARPPELCSRPRRSVPALDKRKSGRVAVTHKSAQLSEFNQTITASKFPTQRAVYNEFLTAAVCSQCNSATQTACWGLCSVCRMRDFRIENRRYNSCCDTRKCRQRFDCRRDINCSDERQLRTNDDQQALMMCARRCGL